MKNLKNYIKEEIVKLQEAKYEAPIEILDVLKNKLKLNPLVRYIEKLKEIDDSIIYKEYLSNHEYLFFTELSYIGCVFYEDSKLNNIFCAPNKIYEYTSFSKPVITSDNPGLKTIVGQDAFGQSTNINDYKIVADVIQKISDNYDLYSYNASQFYIKNEHSKLLKEVINQISKICEKKN